MRSPVQNILVAVIRYGESCEKSLLKIDSVSAKRFHRCAGKSEEITGIQNSSQIQYKIELSADMTMSPIR